MKKGTLIFALFLLALGGFLLHYGIHPFMVADKMNPGNHVFSKTNFLANLFPLIDIILVTLLFMWKKTAAYGYLLNGLLVIYGTVFMAHMGIANFMAHPIPPSSWIMASMFPDITIAWADFFVGKALYDFYLGNPK